MSSYHSSLPPFFSSASADWVGGGDAEDMAAAAALSSYYLSCFDADDEHYNNHPPDRQQGRTMLLDALQAGDVGLSVSGEAGSNNNGGREASEQTDASAATILPIIRPAPAGHDKISNEGASSASGGCGGGNGTSTTSLPAAATGGVTTGRGKKIAFRTQSDVDVLDDGYRWRKYGKKMVKNNPNPRNYYRCSSEGCRVKKRVEREPDDARFVITTYHGVHNHPAAPQPPSSRAYDRLGEQRV